MKWIREIGPGILIAAAIIGPGTVTLCTIMFKTKDSIRYKFFKVNYNL